MTECQSDVDDALSEIEWRLSEAEAGELDDEELWLLFEAVSAYFAGREEEEVGK